MELLDRIKQNAKKHNMRIVLPEGYEERTIKAADIAIQENLARIILIGNPDEINSHAAKLGLKNISKATIVNPKSHARKEHYIDMMVELRKSKGMTKEEASKLIEDPLYLGVLMIKAGDADGEVSGADHSTGDVLRPAFHYVKTAPGISVVSGAFIMILPDKSFGENGVIIFADGAVHPNPNEKELASPKQGHEMHIGNSQIDKVRNLFFQAGQVFGEEIDIQHQARFFLAQKPVGMKLPFLVLRTEFVAARERGGFDDARQFLEHQIKIPPRAVQPVQSSDQFRHQILESC